MSDDIYSEGEYLEKHPTWHTEDSSWKAGHINQMLVKNGVVPQTLLDVGCGAGKILQELKRMSSGSTSYTGIEISPQAFRMATEDNPGGIEFINGGFESLKGKPRFDILMMIDVFEHVEDYYGFLKEARQYGRQFIFHIPLDLSAQTVLRTRPLSRKRKNLGHLHYYTAVSARETLIHSGYKVVDWFYTSSYTDLKQKSAAARMWKYPRKIMFGLMPELTVRLLGGYSMMVLAE